MYAFPPEKRDDFRKIVFHWNKENNIFQIEDKNVWGCSWRGSPRSWKPQRSKKNWKNVAARFPLLEGCSENKMTKRTTCLCCWSSFPKQNSTKEFTTLEEVVTWRSKESQRQISCNLKGINPPDIITMPRNSKMREMLKFAFNRKMSEDLKHIGKMWRLRWPRAIAEQLTQPERLLFIARRGWCAWSMQPAKKNMKKNHINTIEEAIETPKTVLGYMTLRKMNEKQIKP